MTNPSDRLTRIRTGGPIGPADAEWLLGEVERLRAKVASLDNVIDYWKARVGGSDEPGVQHRFKIGDEVIVSRWNAPGKIAGLAYRLHAPFVGYENEGDLKPIGDWPLEVFKPLPEAEACGLRDYGVDDSSTSQGASRDASSPGVIGAEEFGRETYIKAWESLSEAERDEWTKRGLAQ